MKLRHLGKPAVAAALVAAAVLGLRAGERWLGVRARFVEGQQAMSRREFAQAASRFQAILELDPGSTRARLELATAYAAQYVPGGESPANLGLAQQALDELQRVVDTDPKNLAAVRAIAAIHDGRVDYDEARAWYARLVALAPASADPYAGMSGAAWKQVSAAVLDARAGLGLAPDDGQPIPDPNVRRALAARWSGEIRDGIANAEKAIALDSEHDTAMATLSAWYRLRADLDDTLEKHRQNVQAADDWIRKALTIRRVKTERGRP